LYFGLANVKEDDPIELFKYMDPKQLTRFKDLEEKMKSKAKVRASKKKE